MIEANGNQLYLDQVATFSRFLAEHFSFLLSQDKDPWRKIIELRIFARIGEKGGLISSTGIAQVNEKVIKMQQSCNILVPTSMST